MQVRKGIRLHGTGKKLTELKKEYVALFEENTPNGRIVEFKKNEQDSQQWLEFLKLGGIDLYIDDDKTRYQLTDLRDDGAFHAKKV